MLELCFDLSTRGALRVAQHCGGGGKGAVGVIVAASDQGDPVAEQAARRAAEAFRRQEELEREAIPLGGSPNDVLTLSLGLDMGDIREHLGEVRHQLQRQWYDGEN